MDGLIIQFGVGISIARLQTNANFAAGRNIGSKVAHAEGNVVPDIGLSANGVADIDPELCLPIEDGPVPYLCRISRSIEISLKEKR